MKQESDEQFLETLNALPDKYRVPYLYCPKCGASQMETCNRCDQPLHETWIVCPKCAKPVGEKL
ncbi:zinc ribbon domain-containing protein [Pontibacillus sp. HMF3514]|uniref:double zinc ribbon domain-containing protein n=1 Tax=Pontibacillus sp. HMF3514 TaxID=2692425 RepID=UPI00131FA32E|nr:zinc ribbon domain-containing protein [Pontibacillus sp. HMF3514]QHE50810.1 hypothetical protein GS400_01475 [Pontibacillus sp. HMF3514]